MFFLSVFVFFSGSFPPRSAFVAAASFWVFFACVKRIRKMASSCICVAPFACRRSFWRAPLLWLLAGVLDTPPPHFEAEMATPALMDVEQLLLALSSGSVAPADVIFQGTVCYIATRTQSFSEEAEEKKACKRRQQLLRTTSE